MADKHSIAVLHGQGLSNRQIAGLLGLDRGTVNRQVALLKFQNRPVAPTGNSAENKEFSACGTASEPTAVVATFSLPSEPRASDFRGAVGADATIGAVAAVVSGRPDFAENGTLAATTGAPTGKSAENDLIWEEEPTDRRVCPVGKTAAVQNRPGAPTGKLPQKDVLGDVARLSFSSWNDVPAIGRRLAVEVQNQPQAPSGNSEENSPVSPTEPAGAGIAASCLAATAAVSRGTPVGSSTSLCAPFHEFIVKQCELGLEAQRIWQDLVSDHGFTGKYWSVRRYVAKLTARRELPFRRLETAPGVEAQVDFGQGAWVVEPEGKRRRPWVFRLILSHSRKGYSEVVWRQTTEMFIECLENAFRYFGGVPERIVLDNLKAAVSQADWYDPEIHPKLLSFARHYGTVFLPTKPYMPRHKGKVEGGVKYVQSNGLAGRSFESQEQQNEYLWRWEAQVADQRIHGTTKRQVRALFEEQERAALRPLPAQRFPLFREEQRIVHRDGHVEVGKAYYAAPPEYVGRTVWVHWDSRLLRLYNDRWERLYSYAVTTPGKFQTDPRAIPTEKRSAVERGSEALLKQLSKIGPKTGDWAAATVQARGIAAPRVLVGLQSLTRTHPVGAIEWACEVALASGSYRLQTIRKLLQSRPSQIQQQFEFTQEHPVIRSMEDYSLDKLSSPRGMCPEQSLSQGAEDERETQ